MKLTKQTEVMHTTIRINGIQRDQGNTVSVMAGADLNIIVMNMNIRG